MSKQLQIGSEIFNYPEQGQNPGWGEDATAWAEAVTDALASVVGPNDILTTSTALSNNVTSATPVTNLSFNLIEVRKAVINYVVVRVFDSGSTTIVESGEMIADYDGTDFNLAVQASDDSGIRFDANTAGQITYTSDDKTNNVSITMTFNAKTIDNP